MAPKNIKIDTLNNATIAKISITYNTNDIKERKKKLHAANASRLHFFIFKTRQYSSFMVGVDIGSEGLGL